jgi:hypothetical protein
VQEFYRTHTLTSCAELDGASATAEEKHMLLCLGAEARLRSWLWARHVGNASVCCVVKELLAGG